MKLQCAFLYLFNKNTSHW